MVKLKFFIVISCVFLSLFLFIPQVKSIMETVYLDPGERTDFSTIKVNENDVVRWSFNTHDNSFIVYCYLFLYGDSWGELPLSSAKKADSGERIMQEELNLLFVCINTDSVGGYIDIDVHIKREPTVSSYSFIIVVISILSIISVVIIKKMRNFEYYHS